MKRVIMHIDMDAYFASVEQQTNPHLRGKPIAVTGAGKRTVITCPSYEARRYGVKTGMNRWEAKQLCPHIIFIPGCNQRYVDTCTRLVELYKTYTPDVEIYSVDEAFLDLSGSCHLFGPPAQVGRAIKDQIKNVYGITASIGISSNKLTAKIASDLDKPDGLTILHSREQIEATLRNLPVKEVPGIGSKTEAALKSMGIFTCGELAKIPAGRLRDRFGLVFGEQLYFMARGMDSKKVVPDSRRQPAKSVGHSMTLQKDVGDFSRIQGYVLKLSEMVGRRLRRAGYKGKTLHLYVRYADFTSFSKRKSVKKYIDDGLEIYCLAMSILRSFRLQKEVRMVGVSLSNLIESRQMPLFEEDRLQGCVTDAVDRINDRYGEFTVMRGSLLKSRETPDTISPAWRPSGIKRIDYT